MTDSIFNEPLPTPGGWIESPANPLASMIKQNRVLAAQVETLTKERDQFESTLRTLRTSEAYHLEQSEELEAQVETLTRERVILQAVVDAANVWASTPKYLDTELGRIPMPTDEAALATAIIDYRRYMREKGEAE